MTKLTKVTKYDKYDNCDQSDQSDQIDQSDQSDQGIHIEFLRQFLTPICKIYMCLLTGLFHMKKISTVVDNNQPPARFCDMKRDLPKETYKKLRIGQYT